MAENEAKKDNITNIFSFIPHLLFIVAKLYCGIFVVFLLIPPIYAMIKCNGSDEVKTIITANDFTNKQLIDKLLTNKIIKSQGNLNLSSMSRPKITEVKV